LYTDVLNMAFSVLKNEKMSTPQEAKDYLPQMTANHRFAWKFLSINYAYTRQTTIVFINKQTFLFINTLKPT